jgi:hypothetical protein
VLAHLQIFIGAMGFINGTWSPDSLWLGEEPEEEGGEGADSSLRKEASLDTADTWSASASQQSPGALVQIKRGALEWTGWKMPYLVQR